MRDAKIAAQVDKEWLVDLSGLEDIDVDGDGGDARGPVPTARGRGRLVVLCGRSFSGKSTIASWLREGLDGQVISFDAINEERGLRGGEGIPVQDWAYTYDLAIDRVRQALTAGLKVIVDDTSSPRFLRDGWRALAEDLRVSVVVVFVDATLDVLRQRQLANRSSGERQDVTDAVMTEHLAAFEAPESDEDAVRVASDAATPQQVVADVMDALDRAR